MLELELLEGMARLERDREPHCLATVIAVRGSASAKPGAKMLVSKHGENLWGWVGGGCAESFAISEALAAMAERRARIITADLDDEVFGLGMPCGGQMDLFLEPRLPPAELCFSGATAPALKTLAEHYGFTPRFAEPGHSSLSPAEAVRALTRAIAHSRALPFLAFSQIPIVARPAPSEFLILGHSRITEELAKLGALLGWRTRVYGLNLSARHYPRTVAALSAQPDYAGLDIQSGSFVVIASHHKGDHHYLAEALAADAAWVGLIASRKRVGLVFDYLRAQFTPAGALARVSAPAGIELQCRNPGEIALSIVGELLG